MAPVLSMWLEKHLWGIFGQVWKGRQGKQIKGTGKERIQVAVGLILLLVSLFLVVFLHALKK